MVVQFINPCAYSNKDCEACSRNNLNVETTCEPTVTNMVGIIWTSKKRLL